MNEKDLRSLLTNYINTKASPNTVNQLAEFAGIRAVRKGVTRQNWSMITLPFEAKVAAPYLRRIQNNKKVIAASESIISTAHKTNRPSIELIFLSLPPEIKECVLDGAEKLPYRERLDIATMLKIAGFRSMSSKGKFKKCEVVWVPCHSTKGWTAEDRHEHYLGVMAALDKIIDAQTNQAFNNII